MSISRCDHCQKQIDTDEMPTAPFEDGEICEECVFEEFSCPYNNCDGITNADLAHSFYLEFCKCN